jgi:hypothetical protein
VRKPVIALLLGLLYIARWMNVACYDITPPDAAAAAATDTAAAAAAAFDCEA